MLDVGRVKGMSLASLLVSKSSPPVDGARVYGGLLVGRRNSSAVADIVNPLIINW